MTVQDVRAQLHELVDAVPPEELEQKLHAVREALRLPPGVGPRQSVGHNGAQLRDFLERTDRPDPDFAADVASIGPLLSGELRDPWADD